MLRLVLWYLSVYFLLLLLLKVSLSILWGRSWDTEWNDLLRTTRACMLSHFSCFQLCNLKDCGPPVSSIHGVLQARVPEWAAISFSGGSSWPRHRTCLSFASCIGRQVLYNSQSCISSWLTGIGSGGNKSSTSGPGLSAACICFKGLHWKHMYYVPQPPLLFPFLLFLQGGEMKPDAIRPGEKSQESLVRS